VRTVLRPAAQGSPYQVETDLRRAHERVPSLHEVAGSAPPVRSTHVRRRWTDILLYALVADAVLILILTIAPNQILGLANALRANPWTVSAAVLTLLFIHAFLRRRKHWPLYFGLRHARRYPPSWLAGIIGLPFLMLFLALPSLFGRRSGIQLPTLSDDLLRILLLLFIVALGSIILHALSLRTVRTSLSARRGTAPIHPDEQPSITSDPASVLSTDPKALHNWLNEDDEIETPELDAFGHRNTATQLARLLRLSPGRRPTIALLGDQGSGKSSIRCLVRHYLDTPGCLEETVELVTVSLWPYESVEAAASAILSKTVRAIAQHVDTLSIAGVPEQYARLVEAAGGPVARLIGRVPGAGSPEAVLHRLSEVLLAIRVDVVLWVEDLERFRPRPSRDEPESASERLAPLRSLLYLLHRTPGVSVVIATKSMRDEFDIEKLAAFTFEVPGTTPSTVWRILRAFRRESMSKLGGDFIDPVKSVNNWGIVPPDSESFGYWLWDPNPHGPSPQLALGRLLSTPRLLKMALRECRDTWSRLRGEIDFDDLLVCSALRHAAPDVFAWVNENLEHMRSSREGDFASLPPVKAQRDAKDRELKKLLVRGEQSKRRADIEALLGYLFDHYGTQARLVENGERPQRVSNIAHVDYWRRMRSGLTVTTKDSDQEVLRAMDAWWSRAKSPFVDMVLDPERVACVYNFSRRLDGDALCRLLDEVSARLEDVNAADWPEQNHPSIRELWRMMRRDPPVAPELSQRLERTMTRASTKNLALVNSLMFYFLEKSQAGILLTADGARKIRSNLAAVLTESFVPRGPCSFVETLRGGSWYLSVRLAQAARRVPSTGPEDLPFEEWKRFSEVLLVAAEQDALVGLPQILAFLVQETEGADGPSRYTIKPDRAKQLFDMNRLLPLLANADLGLPWQEHVRGLVAVARRYAKGGGAAQTP
jgi:hypothetical protein